MEESVEDSVKGDVLDEPTDDVCEETDVLNETVDDVVANDSVSSEPVNEIIENNGVLNGPDENTIDEDGDLNKPLDVASDHTEDLDVNNSNNNEKKADATDYDLTIHINGVKFRTNRALLTAASRYFRSKFLRLPSDVICDEFILSRPGSEDLLPKAIQSVFDFVHGEHITLSKENLYDVMFASEYLCVDQLADICADHLRWAVKRRTVTPKVKKSTKTVAQNSNSFINFINQWFNRKKEPQQGEVEDKGKKTEETPTKSESKPTSSIFLTIKNHIFS